MMRLIVASIVLLGLASGIQMNRGDREEQSRRPQPRAQMLSDNGFEEKLQQIRRHPNKQVSDLMLDGLNQRPQVSDLMLDGLNQRPQVSDMMVRSAGDNSASNQQPANGAGLLGGLLRGGANGSGMTGQNLLPNFGQGIGMGMDQNSPFTLGQMLTEIPRRTIETVNHLMSNVRNMMQQGNSALMNGLGRNGSNQMRNPMDLMQQLQGNVPNPMNLMRQLQGNVPNPMDLAQQLQGNVPNPMNLMRQLQGNLPNPMDLAQQIQGNVPNPMNQMSASGLTKPLTDSLQQGRAPDMQQLAQGLQSTVSDIGKGLSKSLSTPARASAPANTQS